MNRPGMSMAQMTMEHTSPDEVETAGSSLSRWTKAVVISVALAAACALAGCTGLQSGEHDDDVDGAAAAAAMNVDVIASPEPGLSNR